ncbi:MAG: SRPBCC family protein [Mycobacterium sp.]
MAKVELSRDLSLPPEQAWAHASNLAELGDWLSMHQGWRCDLPDELVVGTTLVGVAGAKGLRNRVTWTVREIDAPTLLELVGDGVGGTKYALKLTVAPAAKGAAGCTFTVRIDMTGRPLFGPIGATAARAVKGDIERSMKQFEKLYS